MKRLQLKLKLTESVDLAQAARRIHEVAISGASVRFTWRVHRQMESSDIGRADILTILKKCRVIKSLGGGVGEDFHYRVHGNTVDEKGAELVVKIESQPPETLDQLAVISVRWLSPEGEGHEEMPKLRIEHKK